MLKSLQISGIRSFSPNSEVTIEFDEKLTLIIGKNGAGKSTLLECLKVASTGAFPPSSDQGRCFIHEPRLNNKLDLTGSIRLSFTSPDSTTYKVSRSFYLSRKGEKLELRKSENLLSFTDEIGNEVQKSMKVGEINNLVPQLIGLNPAIIEYVCFCHQDESLWPFCESSLLKKVFDQIFNTEEYSKVHENMKKLLKEQKNKLTHKKEELVWVMKRVKEEQDLVESISVCRQEVEKAREALQEAQILEKQAIGRVKNLKEQEKISQVHENLKSEIAGLETVNKQLGDVQAEEADWETQEKNLKEEIESLKAGIQSLQKEDAKTSEKIQKLSQLLAGTQTQEKIYRENLEKVEKKIKEFEGNFEDIEQFELVKKSLKDAKNEMRTLETCLKGEICQREFERDILDQELKRLRFQLSTAEKEGLADEIEFLKQSLVSCEELILNDRECIKSLEENVQSLKKHSKDSLEVHEWNKGQREKSKKFNECFSFFNKVSERFLDIKRDKIKDYEAKVKDYILKVDSEKINFKTKKNESENSIAQLSSEIEKSRNDLKELGKSINEVNQSLIKTANEAGIKFENLSHLEVLIETELTKLQRSSENEEGYLKDLKKIMELSVQNKRCQICSNLVNETLVKSKIERVSKKLAKLKDSNEEENHKKVKYLNVLKLFNELKGLKEATASLEKKTTSNTDDLNKHSRQLLSINDSLENLNNLSSILLSDLQYIPKYLETLNSLNISPEKTLADLQLVSFEAMPTPQKSSINDLELAQQKLEECQNDLQNTQKNKQETVQKIQILEAQLAAVTQEKALLETQVCQSTLKLNEVDLYISKLHEQLHYLFQVFPGKIQELSNKKNSLKLAVAAQVAHSSNLAECQRLSADVSAHIERSDQFKTQLEPFLDSSRQVKNKLEHYLASLAAKQTALEAVKTQSTNLKNLKIVKENLKSISYLNQKLLETAPLLSGYSKDLLESSERDLKLIQIEKAKIEQTLDIKSSQLKTLESRCPVAESSSIKLIVEAEVLEKALEELKVLQDKLESSIISYHRQKIFEVNSILTKLWSETYKGSDIEKILISADVDKSSKRSNFLYKISFFSKGKEVDMRGRCSSGQRMMASLIIRIALAQAFSHNFSIIALDEPTTNMDLQNAEGLAECIAQLSSQYEKLQIIIITHDVDFMRKVIRESPRESYLLVEKKKSSSVITKVKYNNLS